MLEKQIERLLVDNIKKLGGMCFKFVSTSCAGSPDRLVLLPNSNIVFVELKTEKGRLSSIQKHTIDEMKKRGADVRVLYGRQDVKNFIADVMDALRHS